MSESINNYAIVFDTNIFGNPDNYNFSAKKLKIFCKNFCSASNIDIFMPDIVKKELEKHIKENIELEVQAIKKGYVKNYLTNTVKNNIIRKEINKLDSFIDNYKINIINCNQFINIEEVNNWYFNKEYPFEDSKKNEFPDAMIISAIKNYFKKSTKKYSIIYILSKDKGFTMGVNSKTQFIVCSDFNNIYKEIMDIEESDIIDGENYIYSNNLLENLNLYNIILNDDSIAKDLSVKLNRINEIELINIDDEKYLFEIEAEVEFTGHIILSECYEIYDDYLKDNIIEKSIGKADKITCNNITMYIQLIRKDNNYVNYLVEDKVDIYLDDYFDQTEHIWGC